MVVIQKFCAVWLCYSKYIEVKDTCGIKNGMGEFSMHDLPTAVQYTAEMDKVWPDPSSWPYLASLAFNAPLWQGPLLKISPGWAAGVPHEHTQVCLLTLPTVWGFFRLGAEGLLVTPLRPICVMLWAWAPKSTPGSYKRLGSSLSHLDVVLQTTKLLGANVLLIFPY